MVLSKLFQEFFNSEKSSGIILLGVTTLSLILANSGMQAPYLALWSYDVAGHDLVHWINDGLMAVFFLLIGLELEREIYNGELSDIRSASLPLIGALGGMLVPAVIFSLFNYGTSMQSGAGIPMATDIAFAIGILSLLGNRVPASLKVFLTALAVIDDLGAILIIAFFYTTSLSWLYLSLALAVFGILLIINRQKVHNLIPYLVGGIIMWYLMLHSGVHASITGVLLAFAIPFGDGGEKSPSYILQHYLHKPVAFFILPLFAAANTCLVIGEGWSKGLLQPNSLGIISGLVLGKPIGILLFAMAGVALGLATLPADIKWKDIAGAGMLSGIGFTMSIFITLLAFNDIALIDQSKIAILLASLVAGISGYIFLRISLQKHGLIEQTKRHLPHLG